MARSPKTALDSRDRRACRAVAARWQPVTGRDDDLRPSDRVSVPTLLHVTAHDGHMRESLRSEVGEQVASELRFLLALACALDAAPVGIGVSGWVMTARERPGSLSVRVYGPNGLAVAAFAAGAEHHAPRGRDDAWRRVVGEATWLLRGASPDAPPLVEPPEPPWLIGALLPAVLAYPESVRWLADFERCAAWVWLDIAMQANRGRAARETIQDIALTDAWILGGRRGVPA